MSNSLEEKLEGLIDQRLEAAKDQEDATDVVPDSGAQVTTDKLERPQTRDAQTFRLLRGLARGNQRQAESAAEKLVRGGHYGTDAAEQARSSGDYYSTVVNADGQFLLPTEVRQTIEELADQVGVARQVVNTFSQITGTLRVPGASGAETSASAVAEGGTITSTKRAFEAVELNPQKWATVVPWTYEAEVEMGARILQDVNRAIARAFAHAEDDSMLNGDGSATYNSIHGILSGSRSGVGQLTLASGSTAPEDIDPDDIIVARNEIDPGARQNLTLIFHPDMEAVFRTKKDDSGEYLFMYNDDGDVDTINGIPVLYTEVLPATGENTGTDFGVLVNGDYWHMALGQGLTTEEARTGTVEDADTGSDINLFTQDLRALKVRSFFDMDANFNSAFMKFTTAAS
jgi:HK97 family phage major capsid protein